MQRPNWRLMVILLGMIALLLAACTGQEGPAGPAGAVGQQGIPGPAGQDGEQGLAGPAGQDGISFSPPEFVGSQACAECHQETYDTFMLSGHPYKLNPVVDGEPPEYPFTEIPSPPEGYTWDDISYVIGGYNWKARFIDQDGYIITGADENATTQYNFYNEAVDLGDDWVGYHAGESELPYDCGTCHTTGYLPEGNQDGRPGLIGTWALPGVQCEECHGPGSLHTSNPLAFRPIVDRDSESCGTCHSRGATEEVNASNGFIQHHEQYEELFQGKHVALDCVVCHDPHTGVVQLRQNDEQTTRTSCDNCHYTEGQNFKLEPHPTQCISCHMPRVTKSAVGDPERFTGDIRTHLMAIDPLQVGQFTEDGTVALSQLSLNYACRHCHVPAGDGDASPKTDEELIEAAVGFHLPATPTPAPVVEETTPQ